MKILVIGGLGKLGQFIVKELKSHHEVLTAGKSAGDVRVDIESAESIKTMYETVKNLDAVVMTVGHVRFARLDELTNEDFQAGIRNKLMGQINCVLIGRHYLKDGGSFTLTSGVANRDPIPTACAAATVNGALEAFVKTCAFDLKRGLRINVVSPNVLTESMAEFGKYFVGYKPVPGTAAALPYRKSIEGLQTGQVFVVDY